MRSTTQIATDASFVIGLLDPQGIWHDPAVAVKGALQALKAEIAVDDCLLSETLSKLARRIHELRRAADRDLILEHVLDTYTAGDILGTLPDVPLVPVEIVGSILFLSGELYSSDALIAL